jgi:transposase
MVVVWGLFHRDLSNVRAIGSDEISRQKNHKYVTLVYQIDDNHKRLLWVGDRRQEQTLEPFFKWFGKERTDKFGAICSDMWQPYL